ncbi:hypothetical protein vseg_010770 [Gypsophila vaccaria]
MDYLTRLLKFTTTTMPFQYHPLCKAMKLSSLMFVDDLLLFSKEDVKSMMVLIRTFATFSQASCLTMSRGKSSVYFNGVPNVIKQEIIQVSGCSEGYMPFKDLGVPIKPAKLNLKDCQPILDKVYHRISVFGTRKLSYAGRLTLIKAVLKPLHNYWATIFILPKAVITKIEAIYRNYMWDGGTESLRSPKVSWNKVCAPYKEGGLWLKNGSNWKTRVVDIHSPNENLGPMDSR